MPTTDLAAVAVHEAGHAVMAHMLDVPFRYITLRPHGTADGKVKFRGLLENTGPNRQKFVRVLLAGPAAQAAYVTGGSAWDLLMTGGGQHDMAKILPLCALEGWTVEGFLDWVTGDIKRPGIAERIGIVADELLNRTNALTYPQYLALITSKEN